MKKLYATLILLACFFAPALAFDGMTVFPTGEDGVWSFKQLKSGELVLKGQDQNYYHANGSVINLNWLERFLLRTHETNVRIQILNPVADGTKLSQMQMVHPILLVDGINLNTTPKTLNKFRIELEGVIANGDNRHVVSILQNLGYTPILVQFGETASRSMEENAQTFSKLMTFLADNAILGWQNANAEKFQIIGFSQGGVIGRYGAYLYDQSRGAKPGVRLLTTLDSPHQGAVLPRGLLATLDFAVRKKGEGGDAGAAYLQMLTSPGAKDLLIYNTEMETDKEVASTFEPKTSSDRWLFSTYRNAANYQGFPVTMISNGMLKGVRNYPNQNDYYDLNRHLEKGMVDVEYYGRGSSKTGYSEDDNTEYASNCIYKSPTTECENHGNRWIRKGNTSWDMVQGSTYPFNKTIYDVLHASFLSSMEDKKTLSAAVSYDLLGVPVIMNVSYTLYGKWDSQALTQQATTFIPTVSALDMKCDGNLAVQSECAFTKTDAGINWESPGAITTAKSIYAIDVTHPQYTASAGLRHVLDSDPIDYWRVFCELMKSDVENGAFENATLKGLMNVNQSCLDQSAIPQWFLSKYDITTRYAFRYKEWLYNTARNGWSTASFTIPGGWNPVANFGSQRALTGTDVIEVTVRVPKSFSWCKLDLVLLRKKDGTGWLQLGEQNAIRDGASHKYTWQVPSGVDIPKDYKLARLIMNSLNGGDVEVRSVRVAPDPTSNSVVTGVPMTDAPLYPGVNNQWYFGDWGSHDQNYQDALGTGLKLNLPAYYDGAMWFAAEALQTNNYKNLVVTFWPNTCRNTVVYFDQRTYWSGADGLEHNNFANLGRAPIVVNGMWQRTIPLAEIDGESGVVNRLIFQSEPTLAINAAGAALTKSKDCIIQSVTFAN